MGVGYAGLKDRHAVTRQWFSLHLPGKADPDLSAAEGETHRLGDRVEVRLMEAVAVAGALRFELLSEGRARPERNARPGPNRSVRKPGASGRPPGIRNTGSRHRGSRR